MKKTKKRFLSAIMVGAMAISMIPGVAFADDVTETPVVEDTQSEATETKVAQIGETQYESLSKAVNSDAVKSASAESPVTIQLIADTGITEQITLPANVILDGNGHKITANNASWSTADDQKYMIVASGDHTTVQDIIIDANSQAYGCLQFYTADNGMVSNVTLTNAKQLGLMINASNVTATGTISLSGNGWGDGINVGWGTGITGVESCSLDVSDATLQGVTTIYADESDFTNAGDNAGTKFSVTVPENQSLVPISDADTLIQDSPKAFMYMPISSVEATVTDSERTTYYGSLQNAFAGAPEKSTVQLTAGKEYNKHYTISKALTVKGAAGATVSDISVMNPSNTVVDEVIFDGITFTGASNEVNLDTNPSALYLQSVTNAVVRNCNFDLANDVAKDTFAIVTGTTINTLIENCTFDGYDAAGAHNPNTTQDNVTYRNNVIKDASNGIVFYGTDDIVVEDNSFENSNGLRFEPAWNDVDNICDDINVSENKFNVPEGSDSFAIKTTNTDGQAGVKGLLTLNYNYWGSEDPDFTSLIQVGSSDVTIVTDEFYKEPAMTEEDLNTYVPPYDGKNNYPVNIKNSTNGTVSVAKTDEYANPGETIVVTVTPDAGYKLDKLTVSGGVDVTDNEDGTYSFTMPASAVTITATFVEDPDYVEPTPEPEPTPDPTPSMPFTDVNAGDWFYDVVQYAYDNGLMTGTSATTFEPNTSTTRGMIVAVLNRLEGGPTAEAAGFTDVNAGDWYADAVNWAASVGIVNGFEDNTFRANDPITREQMAAILYNYADYKGYDVSERADLSGYADADSISGWALDTLEWANAEGLITGMSADTIAPQGQATRAQVAAMFQRFLTAEK